MKTGRSSGQRKGWIISLLKRGMGCPREGGKGSLSLSPLALSLLSSRPFPSSLSSPLLSSPFLSSPGFGVWRRAEVRPFLILCNSCWNSSPSSSSFLLLKLKFCFAFSLHNSFSSRSQQKTNGYPICLDSDTIWCGRTPRIVSIITIQSQPLVAQST